MVLQPTEKPVGLLQLPASNGEQQLAVPDNKHWRHSSSVLLDYLLFLHGTLTAKLTAANACTSMRSAPRRPGLREMLQGEHFR